MNNLFKVSFLGVVLLTGCQPRIFNQNSQGSIKESEWKEDKELFFRPAGKWTGVLQLPTLSERKKDGGVWIILKNSPEESLKGKKIWLTFPQTSEMEWVNEVKTDVSFSAEAKEHYEKGFVLPKRIDGWKKVSLLESLAGAKKENNVNVLLKSPELKNNTLYVNQEPVLISGHYKALVRFGDKISESRREASFYNIKEGDFTVKKFPVYINTQYPLTLPKDQRILRVSTHDIDNSPLNKKGFYVYGEWNNGDFKVEALEPREPLLVKPGRFLVGKSAAKNFVRNENFKNLLPQQVRQTLLRPSVDEKSYPNTEESANNVMEAHYQIGSRGLLLHVFGWRTHPEEEVTGKVLGNITGHFSFGIYNVVSDSITGEKRFDIEYKQVYAHNEQGVLSGTMKWHHYMGDVKTGWMYSIPITDVLLSTPMLESYKLGDISLDPLKEIEKELEQMHARYRVGAGDGISIVKPWSSCVQDSMNALYAALYSFDKYIVKSSKVQEWIAENKTSVEVTRFNMLTSFIKEVEAHILTMGFASKNWRINADNPIGTLNKSKLAEFLSTLVGWKTVFPRAGFDRLFMSAIDSDVSALWTLQTSMIPGKQEDGAKPEAPTTPLRD